MYILAPLVSDKNSSLALDYGSRVRKQYLRVLLSTVYQNPIMLVLDDAESGFS